MATVLYLCLDKGGIHESVMNIPETGFLFIESLLRSEGETERERERESTLCCTTKKFIAVSLIKRIVMRLLYSALIPHEFQRFGFTF